MSGYRLQAGGLRRVKLQPRMHPESDILADGKMMKEIVFLKQHRYRTPGRRRSGMRLVVNQNRAAHRGEKAGDQIEQRAFARAAGAEHGEAFTLLDGEREAHRQMLVKPGHIIQF